MFASMLICVSGCLSKILARTQAYIHTHVARDDRLDVGVRVQKTLHVAHGSDKESRCPRPAGQRGVECEV